MCLWQQVSTYPTTHCVAVSVVIICLSATCHQLAASGICRSTFRTHAFSSAGLTVWNSATICVIQVWGQTSFLYSTHFPVPYTMAFAYLHTKWICGAACRLCNQTFRHSALHPHISHRLTSKRAPKSTTPQ